MSTRTRQRIERPHLAGEFPRQLLIHKLIRFRFRVYPGYVDLSRERVFRKVAVYGEELFPADVGQSISGSKTVTPVECLFYPMLTTSVVITGCDSLPILQQALHARPQFPADGLFPSRGSSRKDGKGCGSRPVRTLQNQSPL
jgi:hypothetical protein